MKKYILLVDVGNTNIKIGIGLDKKLLTTFMIPTEHRLTSDSFGIKIYEFCRYLNIHPKDFSFWIVSSVVPPLDPILKEASDRYFGCPCFFVPEDVELNIENRYANPSEVGSDRLVTAYGARKIYPYPSIIVVDFGTATTLDCIEENSYLGGLICPGILSSLKALSLYTAKLPQISLEIESFQIKIGDSTSTSMRHGFIFGFASMIEGLCEKLKKMLKGDTFVVATGGLAFKIAPVCGSIQEIRADLLMQGLLYAAELVSLS